MADNEFNFYNSENDGYRGGFGDYADPSPAPVPGPVGPGPESPRKRPGRFTKRAIALLLACVVAGPPAQAARRPISRSPSRTRWSIRASGPRWMWTRWPTATTASP